MKEMEARVWQRVRQSGEPAPDVTMKMQIQNAQELAAVYGRLASEGAEQNRERMRRLQEGEQANIACLKGISLLQGNKIVLKPFSVPKEPERKALEKCYHRSRRAMAEYMTRSVGGEYGEVFRAMADREGQHCVWIAQAMGNL